MKQKLLSLVVTFVAMFACVGSMQAQDWYGEKVQPGKFYIRNNLTGTFLQTASTVLTTDYHNAGLFTLEKKNDGYKIKNSKGNYLTWDGLNIGEGSNIPEVDRKESISLSLNAGKIFEEHVSEGNYTYRIYYDAVINDTYLYLDGDRADNALIIGAGDGKKLPQAYWQLISVEQYNKVKASEDEVEATMVINADAKYGTFVAPFEITLPVDVTAYTISNTTGTSSEDGVAYFAELEAKVPAGTPVVVYKEDGLALTTYHGIPVDQYKDAATVTGANGLVGVLVEGQSAPKNSYVLNYINEKTAFYIVRSDISVGKNRCYLAPQAEGAAKIAFSFGNPTAVTSVNANATVSAIYNAAGARVSAAQKGMNIIKYSDGSVKKVLVK